MRLGDRAGAPGIVEAYQAGAGRLRFPRGRSEVMVINTSGGLAGGDDFSLSATVDAHTLTISTQACERVYRGEGVPASVEQTLTVGACASLFHLPQPTIVFDGAALRRRTTIRAAATATLVFAEGIVLGRAAMGETVRNATIFDRVDLEIDGRLVFADALRLGGPSLARAHQPATLAGARGIGLVLALGRPDAVDVLRVALDGYKAGASLIGDVAVARILAQTHTALQDGLARAVQALGATLPRAWAL